MEMGEWGVVELGKPEGREQPCEAGTTGQRQVGGDRTSEGWGSALWADTDPLFLAIHEGPGGAECLPSIEQAIRQLEWLRVTGSGARQGEAEAGEVEGTPVQEREQTLQEEGRQSGSSRRRRGDCRFGGEHMERWQCRLHGTERAYELAVERGRRCSWEWRRVHGSCGTRSPNFCCRGHERSGRSRQSVDLRLHERRSAGWRDSDPEARWKRQQGWCWPGQGQFRHAGLCTASRAPPAECRTGDHYDYYY